MRHMKHPTLVIIGGSYVGSVLALSLAQRGLPCHVLEQRADMTMPDHANTQDTRHFGLTRSSRKILEHLGLWSTLAADTLAITQMSIRTRAQPTFTLMTLGQQDTHLTLSSEASVVGRMLPAARLQHVLSEAIKHHPLITTAFNTTVTALEAQQDHWNVIAQTIGARAPMALSATLVIAADGAQSPTRDMLGISTQKKSYHQYAWQWRIKHRHAHQQRGFEYLLAEGPYVVLPRLHAYESKLIWCHPAKDGEALEEQISDWFPEELGAIDDIKADVYYPLHRIEATTSYTNAAVLIGDAYLRVHPVGAQGLNLGLRDAWALAAHIATDYRLGLAIGDATRLAAYQRARAPDRMQVKWLTDTLGHRAGQVPLPLMRLAGKLLRTKPARSLVRHVFHGE